jgi:hypothetical protein
MATGVTIPGISAPTTPEGMSGLRSLISSFFASTETQPKYKDNQAWNDPINGDVKGLFRVYYQNVHGVPCNDVHLSQDLQALQYDVSCFCLSETNLDWNRPYVQSEYLARQQKMWVYSATSFSSINMESSSDYMTGGMLTSTVDRWSSHVFNKDSDSLGMGHLYQTLVGKRNSKIMIITGYHCARNTSGDSSAWTQQIIFMKDRQSKTAMNPRKQFLKDLTNFINQKQSQKHEIILNLDANEALGEESQGIAKLMRECNLVDLHNISEMEPEQQLQDTYQRGTKQQIDFMLGIPWKQMCVQQQGALEYNDGIMSDHRGLYVDLDAALLFGGTTDNQVASSSRGFTSKNEKKAKRYLDELDKYFIDHNIDSQIDSLVEDAPHLTRNQLKH